MKSKKKLKVKAVQEIKQITCNNCSNFLILEGNIGICKKRERIVLGNYNCPNFKEGEPMKADLDTVAMFYQLSKDAIEEYQKMANTLRDILIQRVEGKRETDNFVVSVTKVKSKRLNTEKVRKYLKKRGILDKFLTESSYYRVEVKGKIKRD
ncbi:hypothetical protein J7J18_04875 [bacterium]|nr:hypothetical protein [bacterium]